MIRELLVLQPPVSFYVILKWYLFFLLERKCHFDFMQDVAESGKNKKKFKMRTKLINARMEQVQ